MGLSQAIAEVRDAVCAVLRLRTLPNHQINAGIVGTAWCVVGNRYLVTAEHIFNEGKPRDVTDRFYVLAVPQNGLVAYHAPVVSFVVEDAVHDMAIIEIDPANSPDLQLKNVPITFRHHADGEKVLTFGFPAPHVYQAQVGPGLVWLGGELFLKSHANEGIISGQFDCQGAYTYEFNVSWYHGESGGPIFSLNPVAVFSIMHQYRNVATPHGTIPGPHQGRSLASLEQYLRQVGATII